ncbi:MAG: thioredoxin family protein [Patescibacteria group bacterium]|nr:thioredoxin family protein [Patescibacteria group bacterium]MDD5294538.1 thioredoxin family protein [Patescibacteria group bacterium]MDD5554715.1 thioredoxin family protein [Patescibacteria group bacterium]
MNELVEHMKVLKFGAVWCMQCLVMRPVWEEIEAEIRELETEYFDIDENPEMKEKYGLKDVPIFIFLDKDGNEILRLEGLQNKEELMRIIKENF